MTTEPTDQHREQAREIVNQTLYARRVPCNCSEFICEHHNEVLIERIASFASSRDAEIRQVLEGLMTAWFNVGPIVAHWCQPNTGCSETCRAARALWSKLQPKESNNDVD